MGAGGHEPREPRAGCGPEASLQGTLAPRTRPPEGTLAARPSHMISLSLEPSTPAAQQPSLFPQTPLPMLQEAPPSAPRPHSHGVIPVGGQICLTPSPGGLSPKGRTQLFRLTMGPSSARAAEGPHACLSLKECSNTPCRPPRASLLLRVGSWVKISHQEASTASAATPEGGEQQALRTTKGKLQQHKGRSHHKPTQAEGTKRGAALPAEDVPEPAVAPGKALSPSQLFLSRDRLEKAVSR